jgi:DNA-binding transcriptional LysR family regulator
VDIRVFKTFLEVSKTKHFGKAAENLYITQGAVSARIKQLEDFYSTKLFIREKNNIRLTSSGERLLSHAEAIVEQLANSRLNIQVSNNNRSFINIAATANVWDAYFVNRISNILGKASDFSVGAEISVRESIHRRLIDKTLDIGIVTDPLRADELNNEKMGDFELVLVSASPEFGMEHPECPYVLVDWGMSFLKEHNKLHDFIPIMRTTTAKVALDLILELNGAAYLPKELIQSHVEDKTLHIIESPLNITRNIYLSYHKNNAQIDQIKSLVQQLD